jgi:mono/diheme cytochrome c family protein
MSDSCSRRPAAGVTPPAVVPRAMPAFGAALSDAQIDEIVKYIRALKPTEG